uniref:Uncharacterized protein n=1 Tax=Cannabis sativa TaxID=3483 RepID=A0A803PDD9_CANSA
MDLVSCHQVDGQKVKVPQVGHACGAFNYSRCAMMNNKRQGSRPITSSCLEKQISGSDGSEIYLSALEIKGDTIAAPIKETTTEGTHAKVLAGEPNLDAALETILEVTLSGTPKKSKGKGKAKGWLANYVVIMFADTLEAKMLKSLSEKVTKSLAKAKGSKGKEKSKTKDHRLYFRVIAASRLQVHPSKAADRVIHAQKEGAQKRFLGGCSLLEGNVQGPRVRGARVQTKNCLKHASGMSLLSECTHADPSKLLKVIEEKVSKEARLMLQGDALQTTLREGIHVTSNARKDTIVESQKKASHHPTNEEKAERFKLRSMEMSYSLLLHTLLQKDPSTLKNLEEDEEEYT